MKKICPLCNKQLECARINYINNSYNCPNYITRSSPNNNIRSYHNHYILECYNELPSIEIITIFPWRIHNLHHQNLSKLFKLFVNDDNQINGSYLIVELPLIKLLPEKNLLAKINSLITFL